MRLVAWNCAMALHRKIDALMALRPDLAVISEAAEPGRLLERAPELAEASLVWVGTNPHKGLLLVGFGTTRLEFNRHRHDSRLHWMAPVTVRGLPGLGQSVHLLGVWAQNASEGNRQKDNPGFLQRKRMENPPLRFQAVSGRAAVSTLQFHGSNSSIRLLGCWGMRWSTSASHA